MRFLALSALAALALAAVPTASAVLEETICVPETSPIQVCVRQHVSPGLPTDPTPTDVCAIAGSAHESVFACVFLVTTGNGDDCLFIVTSVAPPVTFLCL